MNHGSLFSGIGGFDLAAEWMGWSNKFHCEWNPFGQKVLKHYWPEAESYTDITKTDFTLWRGKIDILTGGFQCQPYSQAGKRLGKEDDRHLWPEMLRAIREIQPRYVVGENVSGLVNWNGGMVFNEVQAELEAEGYEVRPFILPACAVNAPHRRDRVWFIAYAKNSGYRRGKSEQCSDGKRELLQGKCSGCKMGGEVEGCCGKRIISDSESGWERRIRVESQEAGTREGDKSFGGICGISNYAREIANWSYFPTQSPVCDGNDGLSSRLDGITFPKWRNESIKAGGNAIVPQVAFQIFQAIQEFQNKYGH